MAEGYTITGQTEEKERQPDGTFMPVVVVRYKTTTTPPAEGSVAVPKILLRDAKTAAETVDGMINESIGGHAAIAAL